jgi:hypothetical protein
VLCLLGVVLFSLAVPAHSAHQGGTSDHFLFVWAGDRALKGNDFLAVIDADPASASYGHLVTTLATDQQTVRVHHTEYSMPAGGMLFANDHDAGRTFIFDVRDPLHPTIVTSLGAPFKGRAKGPSFAARSEHAPAHHQRNVNPSTGPVIRTFSKTGLSDI